MFSYYVCVRRFPIDAVERFDKRVEWSGSLVLGPRGAINIYKYINIYAKINEMHGP